MLRVQQLSDLHLEFYLDKGKALISTFDPTDVDVLALCGDIHVSDDMETTRTMFARFKAQYKDADVVFVPGNHEYYKTKMEDAHSRMQIAAAAEGVYMLGTDRPALIKSKRFIGDTMWFRHDPLARLWQAGMTDFHIISGFVPTVYNWNEKFVEYAACEIRERDIVITHHLPSKRSVPEQYKTSPLNAFFVCNMEAIIRKRKPALWLHGHTHDSCDYMIGNTRIVCNPRGYPGQAQLKRYNPKLVLEVP